ALNSKTVDARADIYSLGCTTYYLLTGQAPFAGTAAQRLAKHQTTPMPDVRLLREDCPDAFADLITRMAAKKPDDRPNSAVELLTQLKRMGAPVSDGPRTRRVVAPAGDTVVDDATYQATLDDSSLSADGEVVVSPIDDEIDFGSLPPMDLGMQSVGTAAATSSVYSPAALAKSPAKSKRSSKSSSSVSDNGGSSQQLLLGFGLAVAVMALVAVVGLGVHSMSKPLENPPPKIKVTESGKSLVILRE
ncbi:MAG: protein kinase domain-containing protein, partial [Rubripirellula sp.]